MKEKQSIIGAIKSTYNDELQCEFYGWRVRRFGEMELHIPKNNVCDMSGAINIAEMLMPTVFKISVFAGLELDIMYIMDVGKQNQPITWTAYDKRKN